MLFVETTRSFGAPEMAMMMLDAKMLIAWMVGGSICIGVVLGLIIAVARELSRS